MKRLSILGSAVLIGCMPERITSASAPSPLASHQVSRDSLYVAMCQHRPGAMRLYGCTEKGYGRRGQPLIILDGKALSVDTAGRGKAKRERVMRQLDLNRISNIMVVSADNPAMLAKYGKRARNGVIVITLLPNK
jgi:hypothetical protein